MYISHEQELRGSMSAKCQAHERYKTVVFRTERSLINDDCKEHLRKGESM